MDVLDKDLCVMVLLPVVMAIPKKQIIFRNAAHSPLGRVTLAGYIRNSQGVRAPRILGQYALVYLLDGSGRYCDANGVDQPASPGDLIVVFPDLPHQYGPGADEHWTEFFLCFGGPVFDLWRQVGLLNEKLPVLHLAPVHEWLQRFESILGHARREGFVPPVIEVCRLQQLLADVVLGMRNKKEHPNDLDWASRACALLEAERGSRIDLGDLARTLGMGYESFRKRFTRLVGQPPARYRIARLIDQACEMMQQENRTSDKEIAEVLGFCDEFHFSRRFKRIVGESPRQFRRRIA